MNARATRRGAPAAVLWGGLGALAWAAFTVVVGGGSAQADEHRDTPLLDGVTSLISQTVDTVGDTVAAVTAPITPVVTEVVEPVVTQVAQPVQQAAPAVVETVTETVAAVPVVGPATAPVVTAVGETAEAVVEPVGELLQAAPVGQIVRPIKDAVTRVPVVGDLLTDLGAADLIDGVVGIVDDTTGLVGGVVVDETVSPIIDVLAPAVPATEVGVPALPAASAPGTPTSAPAPSPTSTQDRSAQSRVGFASPQSAFGADDAAASSTTEAPASPTGAPFGGPVAPSSSAASGGASPLAHARLDGVAVTPLHAWERVAGASDDVLPTSLISDTDVSPD
ncbi:hypothetical protein [Microbacterium sp. 179-I 3D4 NHS]|uniref:hypothetical protein n=1 Tax=Microbacterium sp. 179-I 3D4 NHS TaxID=3142381 RepID=UPI0039A0AAB2